MKLTRSIATLYGLKITFESRESRRSMAFYLTASRKVLSASKITAMRDDLLTRGSLIARLKSAPSERDWEHFYGQYWAVILSFARRQGLDESSARDVLQETMVLLMRKLPEFAYDPARGRFRNWLLTLVAGKSRDALRRRNRHQVVSLDEPALEGGPSLLEKLADEGADAEDVVELSWMRSLAEDALRRVEGDPQTKSATFAAFKAYAIDGRPVADVAREFGLKENALYQIKNRLLKRLRDEVAELENPS